MRLLVVLVLVFSTNLGFCQNVVRVYLGCNITNTKFHRINNTTGIDSSGFRRENYILPFLGSDLDLKISNELTFSTGLGVSWMGSKKYHINIPEEFNIDSNLRLGYIRIPLFFKYSLSNDFSISIGYSFNYNFRKNQQFYSSNDQTFELINIYKPVHHAINFGISYEFSNWNLLINYHKGVSKIYDSKSYHENYRIYLTLGGVQITVGYLFKD